MLLSYNVSAFTPATLQNAFTCVLSTRDDQANRSGTNMRNYTNENFLKIMHLKQKKQTNKKTAFDIKGKLFIQD